MDINELNLETWQVVLIAAAVLWEIVWKGFALWRAARNDQSAWFTILIIFNTIGILPIIYLLTHKENE